MTWQEPVLPQDDGELLLAWYACGSSHSATARMYGCDEAAVRRRIKAIRLGGSVK